MKLKFGAEEVSQHLDVEKVAIDGAVSRDGVTKVDVVLVLLPGDAALIKEMGEIILKEINELLHERRRATHFSSFTLFALQ